MAESAKATYTRVRQAYGEAAGATTCCEPSCCGPLYTSDRLAGIPRESFLGLGSGNPVQYVSLRPGEVVVDLGSGAGVDVFVAAQQVGSEGLAIGIDMTEEMLNRARRAQQESGVQNVAFYEGVMERLPLGDNIADVVLSNCVINLSPDKSAALREAFRILRPGGRLVISDIVQERTLGLIDDACGCVATALVRATYLAVIQQTGFPGVAVLEDRPWLRSTRGVDASAITLRAMKPRSSVFQKNF